jgi:hypothetical protein
VSWSRNAPSLPACSSGATASQVRSSRASSSSRVRRTRPRGVTSIPSRRSGGSDCTSAECRDSALWSL